MTLEVAEGQWAIINFDGCGQSSKKPFCDGTHKKCGWLRGAMSAE